VDRRSPTAERHAQTLRIALMEAAPAGLAFPQLMSVCELSRHQVRSGLGALRDICAERGWPPILWNRAKGYRFSADADELEAWERAWAGVKTIQIRRMVTGTLAPHAKLFPKSRWVKYMLAQMTAVESALDMIANPQLQ